MSIYETRQAKKVIESAVNKANKAIEAEHEKGIFADGDPNHPKYNNGYNYATGKYVNLFGYDQDTFLAKQY